nr:50S ribosome-binding GTPase [Helicobacter pylori]
MKNIYLGVEKSIKELQSIFKNADDKDEKLKRFNQEALEVFQKLERESLKELESLKNNEEWENFAIAFYGETGAGKSTLIECLRMFFKEQSKVVQQERFKRFYSTYQNNYQNDERNKQAILNELTSLQVWSDYRRWEERFHFKNTILFFPIQPSKFYFAGCARDRRRRKESYSANF